jgi:FkbM family methyltransferase
MIRLLKTFVKNTFPQSVLRWRAHKIISGRMDPDLYLLANFKQYLSDCHDGQKFIGHFSTRNTGIDIGACGGEYSIIMAAMFGKVLSVEPTSDMVGVLRSSLPDNCEVIECALGEALGEVSLRVPKIDGSRMHALATIADHGFDFSNIGVVDTTVVKQLTIDQIVSERNLMPSFIKIDVEGYEGKVLLGSVKVIEACKPVFMVEIEKRHNKQFGEIFSLLGSYGYVPYHFRAGKLALSGPAVVEESYQHLRRNEISGMTEVRAVKKLEHYINNFVFLPVG